MSEFGDLLKTILDQSGMSQMDLARALKTSSSVISQTCSGQRLPPLERIGVWAEALGLNTARKESFIIAAHLAHAPERVRQQVGRLQETADGLSGSSSAVRRVRESASDDEAVANEVAIAIADCHAQCDPAQHVGIPPLDLAWVSRGVVDGLLHRLEREWIPSSAVQPLRVVQAALKEAAADFSRTLRPSDPATVGPALRRLGAALHHARSLLVPGVRPRRRR